MKTHSIIIAILIHIQLIRAFNHQLILRYQLKENNISVSRNLAHVNISKYCDVNNKNCIWKCCPLGEVIVPRKRCVPSKYHLTNAHNTTLHTYNSRLLITNKSQNDFQFVPNLFSNQIFRNESFDVSFIFIPYLSEDGNLYTELPNVYDRWQTFNHDQFCVDLRKTRKVYKIKFYARFMPSFDDDGELIYQPSVYRTVALSLCSFFLLLIIVVYSILPNLRNLNGWIVKAFISSLVITSITENLFTTRIYEISIYMIIQLTHYFGNMASYCWTNIMFYDIWRMLRNQTNESTSRRKEYKTFVKYCAHGYGLPLVMTIAVVILDVVDMRHLPWFITPKLYSPGITLEVEQAFYAFSPGCILLLFNMFFGIKSLWAIYRAYTGNFSSTDTAHEIQYKRLKDCSEVTALLIIEAAMRTYAALTLKRPFYTYPLIMGFTMLCIYVCDRDKLTKLFKMLFK